MQESKIKLARVDFRLMHGQVVTTWLQQVSADSILILDDQLAKDKFLANVFLMAAPAGVKVGIRSIGKGVESFNNNVYKNKNLIILFKSVANAHKAIDLGLKLESLQIGGLGNSADKKMISNELSISKKEIELLDDIESKGIDISFQVTPKDEKLSLNDVKNKVKF